MTFSRRYFKNVGIEASSLLGSAPSRKECPPGFGSFSWPWGGLAVACSLVVEADESVGSDQVRIRCGAQSRLSLLIVVNKIIDNKSRQARGVCPK